MAFMIGVLRGCTDGVWMGGFGRDGGGRDGGGRIGGGLDGASQDLRRTGSLYTTPARPYPLYKGCATALAWASVLSGGTRDMRARAVGMRSACAQHKCTPWVVPLSRIPRLRVLVAQRRAVTLYCLHVLSFASKPHDQASVSTN